VEGTRLSRQEAHRLAARNTHATTSDSGVVRLRPHELDLRRRPELVRRTRPPALTPRGPRGRRRRWTVQRWLPDQLPRLDSESLEPARARERDRSYRRLLAVADVLAMALALLVCVPLLGDGDALTPLLLAGAPLIVVLSKVLNVYDRDELLLAKTTLDETPKLFQVATLMALLLWLGHSFLIDGALGRKQVLGFWILLAALLPLLRAAARVLARRLAPIENCLLIGQPAACDRAVAKISESPAVHARVVAQLDLETDSDFEEAAAALGVLAPERDIHRVVIAPHATDQGEILNLIKAAKNLGLKVSLLPSMLEVVGSSVEFDDLEGLNVLGVRRFGLTRSSWLVKRSTDIVGAGVGLILLSPLLLAIAIAIRIDSRGPVLFRQERVGRGGRVFRMLKFRSMVKDADRLKAGLAEHNESDGLFKIADDPRVTRVGGWLRRTSLDELPQLLNVLRGEMSLVGPRPLVLEDDSRVEGWDRRRLHLTPGMTGPWQVLGSARIPLNEMVKLDYLYVGNWSLWGDLKILARTVGFVLRGRGL
jgi:exopolysaccharide biosynthesis polyprenyl glycosylphosphotransferase